MPAPSQGHLEAAGAWQRAQVQPGSGREVYRDQARGGVSASASGRPSRGTPLIGGGGSVPKRTRIRIELGPILRCPFCHDGVHASPAAVCCRQCQALAHGACWAELGRCGACRGREAEPARVQLEPAVLRVEGRSAAGRCRAITRSGRGCRRRAVAGDRCQQHAGAERPPGSPARGLRAPLWPVRPLDSTLQEVPPAPAPEPDPVVATGWLRQLVSDLAARRG